MNEAINPLQQARLMISTALDYLVHQTPTDPGTVSTPQIFINSAKEAMTEYRQSLRHPNEMLVSLEKLIKGTNSLTMASFALMSGLKGYDVGSNIIANFARPQFEQAISGYEAAYSSLKDIKSRTGKWLEIWRWFDYFLPQWATACLAIGEDAYMRGAQALRESSEQAPRQQERTDEGLSYFNAALQYYSSAKDVLREARKKKAGIDRALANQISRKIAQANGEIKKIEHRRQVEA